MTPASGTCSICGGRYTNHGCNPDPFDRSGRACHDCDHRFVTPARMYGVSDPEILALLTRFAFTGRHLVMATAKARVLFPVEEP